MHAENRTLLVAYLTNNLTCFKSKYKVVIPELIAALISNNRTMIFIIIIMVTTFLQSPKNRDFILYNPLFASHLKIFFVTIIIIIFFSPIRLT